jgi:NAD(P)H-flavin reductase
MSYALWLRERRLHVYEIKQRQDYSDVTFMLEVEHPLLARAAHPGQFVIVMGHAHAERIPLTIADYDREAGTVTLVIQAVGKTTRELQRDCVAGASLYALVGPMGLPMQAHAAKTVVCVGGGLGVAPVFPQLRAYREQGVRAIGVVGFRTGALAFWQDRFAAHSDELILCTDDGSAGRPGFVSQALAEVLAREPVDEVVAIGPPAMMRACAEVTRASGVHITVSLNPIMVDGTGMCGGCRVRVGGQMRFACVDGPDFDGHAVDWDELIARLGRFRRDEARALARYQEHACRLRGEVQEASGS